MLGIVRLPRKLPMTTTDATCPLWRRLFALLYDLVAVTAIVMVVGLVCQLATGGQLITTGSQVRIAWWYQPLQAAVVGSYFLLSWLRGGQTLGMRPWRIRVAAADGSSLTWRRALLRLCIGVLPLALLLLAPATGLRIALGAVAAGWIAWFGVALFDRRHRALHDLLAGAEIRRLA